MSRRLRTLFEVKEAPPATVPGLGSLHMYREYLTPFTRAELAQFLMLNTTPRTLKSFLGEEHPLVALLRARARADDLFDYLSNLKKEELISYLLQAAEAGVDLTPLVKEGKAKYEKEASKALTKQFLSRVAQRRATAASRVAAVRSAAEGKEEKKEQELMTMAELLPFLLAPGENIDLAFNVFSDRGDIVSTILPAIVVAVAPDFSELDAQVARVHGLEWLPKIIRLQMSETPYVWHNLKPLENAGAWIELNFSK